MACHKFHLVWAKKTHLSSGDMPSVSPAASQVSGWYAVVIIWTNLDLITYPEVLIEKPGRAIVEYPSFSRPSSMTEDVASLSVSLQPREVVKISLNREATGSFGFDIEVGG